MKIPHTHRDTRRTLAALALLAAGAAATGQVSGQSRETSLAITDASVIQLDAYNVTAMRETKRFFETPASVVTLDKVAIEATGADNMYDAIRFADGVVTDANIPNGQFFSSMTARNVMRGVTYGTLMLVDGIPANMNGFYFTGDIPVQAVKRMEVVKGASSSLYGSDAVGGIINMITGHPAGNSASVAFGSKDYENYSFSLYEDLAVGGFAGGVSVLGVYQNSGGVTNLSSTGYAFGGSNKRTGRIMLSLGSWSLSWQRTKTKNEVNLHASNGAGGYNWSSSAISRIYDGDLTSDYFRANGRGKNWELNLFANIQHLIWKNISMPAGTLTSGGDIDGNSIGGDFQYQWKPSWADFMFGVAYSHDYLDNLNLGNGVRNKPDRDNAAVFVRASKTFLDTWTATVSLRESYVSSGNMNALTPQFQLIKTFPHRISAYANVGRAFRVANIRTLYVNGPLTNANPNLDPEEGWNYEAGVKWEGKRTLASIAAFHMDYDSNMTWKANNDGGWDASTTPFRNMGVELTVAQKICSTITIEAGASYAKPEEELAAGWKDQYGKWTGSLRTRWAWSRYSTSFNVSWLGDRPQEVRDMVNSSIMAGVSFGRFGRITGSIDNLFNRRDITNHPSSTTGARYYMVPRTYRISYEKTF